MPKDGTYDVVVMEACLAGRSAAIQAARSSLKTPPLPDRRFG